MGCEFALNKDHNSQLGCSSFFASYVFNPRIGTFMDNGDPFVELPAGRADVRDWIERVKSAYVVIRGNIERAQDAMRNRPMGAEIEFDVGDLVLVEMEAVRSSTRTDEAGKLQMKWMGPYKDTKKLGGKSYEFELPASMSRVTNHFHVCANK